MCNITIELELIIDIQHLQVCNKLSVTKVCTVHLMIELDSNII